MMKINATHWIVGVRHCVEWPDGKWIFIQDVKVCVILEKKNKNLLLYVNKNNQDRKLISSLRERYLY